MPCPVCTSNSQQLWRRGEENRVKKKKKTLKLYCEEGLLGHEFGGVSLSLFFLEGSIVSDPQHGIDEENKEL